MDLPLEWDVVFSLPKVHKRALLTCVRLLSYPNLGSFSTDNSETRYIGLRNLICVFYRRVRANFCSITRVGKFRAVSVSSVRLW